MIHALLLTPFCNQKQEDWMHWFYRDMNFTFSIVGWSAIASGFEEQDAWIKWAQKPNMILCMEKPVAKSKYLSMMQARRLTLGCRYAVDCGLGLFKQHADIDAIVFTSRHSELERNYNLMQAIVIDEESSPTDFTMSVHNTAAAIFSMAAETPIPASSISAGNETFLQALIEVQTFFNRGYKRVLLVDFESYIPNYYLQHMSKEAFNIPYAIGFIFETGEQWHCLVERKFEEIKRNSSLMELPKSLEFLYYFLRRSDEFSINSVHHTWSWKQK